MADKITAKKFKLITGFKPVDDDLERANCPDAGKEGHKCCGMCPVCGRPRWGCNHQQYEK